MSSHGEEDGRHLGVNSCLVCDAEAKAKGGLRGKPVSGLARLSQASIPFLFFPLFFLLFFSFSFSPFSVSSLGPVRLSPMDGRTRPTVKGMSMECIPGYNRSRNVPECTLDSLESAFNYVNEAIDAFGEYGSPRELPFVASRESMPAYTDRQIDYRLYYRVWN